MTDEHASPVTTLTIEEPIVVATAADGDRLRDLVSQAYQAGLRVGASQGAEQGIQIGIAHMQRSKRVHKTIERDPASGQIVGLLEEPAPLPAPLPEVRLTTG